MNVNVLVFILIVTACVLLRLVWDCKNTMKKSVSEISESIGDIPCYKKIMKHVVDSISPEMMDKYAGTANFFSYGAFKHYWEERTYIDLSLDADNNGIPDFIENTGVSKEDFLSAVHLVLKSSEVDIALAKAYTDYIVANVQAGQKIEEDAVKYNESFGKEEMSDPELHPVDTNSGSSGEDDIIERSIEELTSTGTVEDIE